MFEYKDNFLMGPVSGLLLEGEDQFLCSASNATDEQLAELARVVGEGDTLRSSDDQVPTGTVEQAAGLPHWTAATAADAPPLSYDLEQELSRAFDSAPDVAPAPAQAPIFDTQALEEALQKPAAPEMPAPMAEVQPVQGDLTEPSQPMGVSDPSMDFSDMIADELDRALAEEVAADGSLVAADVELTTEPATMATGADQDIERELARLIAGSDNTAEPAPAAPPLPEPALKPWNEPEIVDNRPAMPVELEMPQLAVQPVDFEPPQTADFSDPAAELQPQPVSLPPVSSLETPSQLQNMGERPIETVLAGAAALSAAASSDVAPASSSQEQYPEFVSDVHPGGEEYVDPAFHDNELAIPAAYGHPHAFQKRRSGRRAALAIVAVALMGGVAAAGWNVMGGSDEPAPIILASSEPVKVKPKETGGEKVPNQDQVVFRTVDGDKDGAAKQEKLADKTEQPIAVALNSSTDKVQSRVSKTDSTTTAGLPVKPRRVRTVVVRPDGTIVAKDGSNKEPVKPVETAAVVAPVVEAPTLALRPDPIEIGSPAVKTPVYKAPTAAEGAQKATEPAPVKTAKVEAKPVKAKPVEVPAKEAQEAKKPAPVLKASIEPAAEPKPKAKKAPYSVQISSQRSQAAAEKSYSTLARRYSSIIGGKGVDFQKSTIQGKGVYYRVRIPAESRQVAQRMCSQLKARGGACFVTR